jgi:hypothetical protein
MRKLTVRTLLALAFVLGSVAVTGCYAEAVGTGPESVVVGDYGYEPQYYNGYMVYYDGMGRPFYYAGGAQFFIAANSPYYAGYVAHYRTYGPAYSRWYSAGGYRYRTYRGPATYSGGHHNYTRQYNRGARPAPRHR